MMGASQAPGPGSIPGSRIQPLQPFYFLVIANRESKPKEFSVALEAKCGEFIGLLSRFAVIFSIAVIANWIAGYL